MELNTFYELTRRSISLSKNTGVDLSWCDSVLTVRTDKGLSFLDFSYSLGCFDKEISMCERSISSPKNSPAASLCKSKFIYNEMKNYDYTEMVIDSSFWPHNYSLTQEMTNVVMTAWSPPNLKENASILAVLNNLGGVEMLVQQQYHWKSVINLSPYIETSLTYDASPKSFEELKKSVYIVETCCICWSPILSPDRSCYFVTVQKNGSILFWQISNNEPPILKGEVQTCIPEVKNVLWIQKNENTFWLICADILGQVHLLLMHSDNGNISLLHSHILWEYKDRMISANLQYIKDNDKIILFYSKHRHLVVQVLDDNCKILTQYLRNINDYRITNITCTLSSCYLSTINVKIYKLKINLLGTSLNVEITPVAVKEPYSSYELYSLCFSKSNTLCVLGMIDRKLLCRKEVLKIDLIFLSTESKLNSVIPFLLSNSSEMLTNFWDCMEALRYHVMKTRKMPELDYELLYTEGSNDIYKLKIYYILLVFYLNLQTMALIPSEFIMPQTSIDAVKEKILLLHAQSNIKVLFKSYKKTGKLRMFEKESLYGCLKFLEYYSKNYKSEVKVDENILKLGRESNFEYVCQSCDGKVSEGFTCSDGHLNMYCMLSFTPISIDDYYVCKCCDSTARTDLCGNNLLCVFCDQCLIKPD